MRRLRFAILVMAIGAIGVLAAGCGGSDPNAAKTPANAETITNGTGSTTGGTTTETKPGGSGGAAGNATAGKAVFTGKAGCGGCHTLRAAGASGVVGPNLDQVKPDAATVTQFVTNGAPPMPAFGKDGILNPTEIADVAAYVSSVAGT